MRIPASWDSVFIEMAQVISKRSKDPSTQVGAMLISPDRRRVAIGYNGMVAGMLETKEMWQRPEKYRRVLHAEINAMLNARCDLTGWTLYVTIPPCKDCAKYIIQAGIKRIVYRGDPRSDTAARHDLDFAESLLVEAGVGIEKFEQE